MKNLTWNELDAKLGSAEISVLEIREIDEVSGAGWWSDFGWGMVGSVAAAGIHWLWNRYH